MKKTKNIYFDTETTGLDPWKHGVIQFAFLIEIDGNVVESGDMKIRPFPQDQIDPKALEIHGMSAEEIQGFQDPIAAHKEMCRIFEKYVDKFDKADKFTPIGYNVAFDMEMMRCFFKKAGDNYFGSFFDWNVVDPLAVMRFLRFSEKIDLPDYKLATVCAHFGIKIDAHNALSDITATWELTRLLREKYKDAVVL